MKNKLLWVVPVAAVLILMFLATAFYPAYNPTPKDVPMAVLNNDKGTESQGNTVNIGENFAENLTENENEAMEWKQVDSQKDLENGLENGDYIGAITFDKNFSKDAMSNAQSTVMEEKQKEMKDKVKSGDISSEQVRKMKAQMDDNVEKIEPSQAKIKTIVNEGGNSQVSSIAQQALTKMGEALNTQISKQNVSILEKSDIDIPSSQYDDFSKPVKVESEKLNAVKDGQGGGNGAASMFSPIWMASMIVGVISFFAFKNRKPLTSHKDKLLFSGKILLSILVAAFVGAFIYVYYMGGPLGFNFTQPAVTATFIAIAITGFALLILGSMVWLGIAIIPVFMLFLLFTMQTVMLPKVMLPEFHQNYIIPWNPFYYYVSTLKELLYENTSLAMNGTMWMFIAFIVFGIVSVTMALYFKRQKEN
ncbi:ABC transporter permease [Staphylococcus equorum]